MDTKAGYATSTSNMTNYAPLGNSGSASQTSTVGTVTGIPAATPSMVRSKTISLVLMELTALMPEHMRRNLDVRWLSEFYRLHYGIDEFLYERLNSGWHDGDTVCFHLRH